MSKDGFLVNQYHKVKPSPDVAHPKAALITGASSGLGSEFARQLASAGYNLVLTSRRENRLRELANTLHRNYSVDIQVHLADLSQPLDIESLVSIINSQPCLDLLVNNAGFGTVGSFYQVDTNKEQAMLNVHVVAPVMLTRASLPGMLSRHHGGIIFVASIAGLIPIRNVLYHSTKSFQIHFLEVLQLELHGSGVYLQALCPGYTVTGFHDTSEYTHFTRRSVPHFLWMTSEQVVSESLKALPRNRLFCFPGLINKIAGTFARSPVLSGIIKSVSRSMLYRQKAL